MDPLTQGVLGATASQIISKKKEVGLAALAGCLGGMAPDLDVLITSEVDPLLYYEFHRQFTHSLFFIPFGGLVVALFLWLIFRRQKEFKKLFLYSTMGYATHGLLDGCTSYGTLLFWPFSYERFAWDSMAIIDPVVTLPLLIAVLLGLKTKNRNWSLGAFILFLTYIGFGFFQNYRAERVVTELARLRGHQITRLRVMPTIANLVVWRSIYEVNDEFFVDAIRVSPTREVMFFEGERVKKVTAEDFSNDFARDSVQLKDFKRFQWFADDWLFFHPDEENVVGDLRYSVGVRSTKPLCGIRMSSEKQNEHVGSYHTKSRDRSKIVPIDLLVDPWILGGEVIEKSL